MIQVQLIVVQGKPEGKTIPLVGPVFRVGRNDTCHLRPQSEQVSREHAEIAIGEAGVFVRDLGSRNGTFVNGKPITEPHALKNGELLQIGHLTFAVSIQGSTAEVAAPTRPTPLPQPATIPDGASRDEIDSWLVADHGHPTPDRPSGIYSGDTLTINSFNAAAAANGSSTYQTVIPKPAPAKAAPPAPPIKNALHDIEDFEHLPEGEGDGEPEEATALAGVDGGTADAGPAEMVDESNPFHAAKKAAAGMSSGSGETKSAAASYKDTSDAASDILRKLMDRRRPRA